MTSSPDRPLRPAQATRSALPIRGMAGLCAAMVLLAGCGIVSRPGTYPNPSGPLDGNGLRVDPQTGVVLPGQSESGF
jgi:hypothetical protein